ncbi:MAG: zinc ribbon domain-containing protein [Desulfobacterales bacterium]
MKRTALILFIIVMLMPVTPGIAQNPVDVIDTLDIELWPDYDRPSVLVLLTGTLPVDTRLPASVTLPIPQGAQINAVARIDSQDNSMKDDIFSSADPPGKLTFVTPDLRFRVEYYLPYTVDDNRREFDYTWLADIRVNNLHLRVQRPISASDLSIEPATANVARSEDGFDYHTFPPRTVAAGQPFSLHVEYLSNSAQLSVANLLPPDTGKQPPSATATPRNDDGINWALVAVVAGGLLIFGAVIWQVAARRAADSSRKPVASGVKTPSRAKFCRECGEPLDKDDRYCGGCGLKL